MQETWVQSLGWEKRTSLEKRTATHSSILAWRIPLTEEPGRLIPWGGKEWDTTAQLALYSCLHTHTHTHTHPYTAGNTARLMMKSGSLRRTKTANSVVQDQMPTGLKPRKSPGFNSKGRKEQLFEFALVQPFCIIWAFYSQDEALPH